MPTSHDDRFVTYAGRTMLRVRGGDGTDEEAAAKEKADQEAEAAKAAADKEKADAEAAAAKAKEDEFDPERAKATIAKQRESENKLKAELKAAKEKAEKYDKAEAEKLDETQKAAKRAEDAEAKAADADKKLRKANLLVELSKGEHGIVAPQDAADLIKGVEFDDEGAPTNLTTKGEDGKSLLDTFLEARPHLKGEVRQTVTNTDGGAGNNGGKVPALTAEELEYAKFCGMTPEEYAENKQ